MFQAGLKVPLTMVSLGSLCISMMLLLHLAIQSPVGWKKKISASFGKMKSSQDNSAQQLKEREQHTEEGTELPKCTICLDYINDATRDQIDECHHTFHHGCIEKWYSNSIRCPICRTTAFPVPEDAMVPPPANNQHHSLPSESSGHSGDTYGYGQIFSTHQHWTRQLDNRKIAHVFFPPRSIFRPPSQELFLELSALDILSNGWAIDNDNRPATFIITTAEYPECEPMIRQLDWDSLAMPRPRPGGHQINLSRGAQFDSHASSSGRHEYPQVNHETSDFASSSATPISHEDNDWLHHVYSIFDPQP